MAVEDPPSDEEGPQGQGQHDEARAGIGEPVVVEQVPEGLDEVVEGVELVEAEDGDAVEGAQGVRDLAHHGGGVDDRVGIEPDLEEDAHEVLGVAEVDVGDGQHHGHPGGEEGQQDHEGHRGQDVEVRRPAQQHHHQDENEHLDAPGVEPGQGVGHQQGGAGEVDLLDEVLVAHEGPHAAVDDVGEEGPGQQAAHEPQGEDVQARGVAGVGLDPDDEAEDEGVDDHQGDGVGQGPQLA